MNKREYVTGQLLPKKEWESKSIELNFGEKILFEHKKVRMKRGEDGLNGTLIC